MKFNFFSSPVVVKEDIFWLDNLNKFSDKYIENQIKEDKEKSINNKYSILVHHSPSLINDSNFFNFFEFICKEAYLILEEQGYDLKDYFLSAREVWVQEFSKEGGGHHNTHTHWNGHISGFYFLKCSENTSYPVFHDPRPGKLMIQLPEKNDSLITDASERIHFKPKPGTLIFFNSYLPHEFIVDNGIDPFRFIHFNIQVLPKEFVNKDIKHI